MKKLLVLALFLMTGIANADAIYFPGVVKDYGVSTSATVVNYSSSPATLTVVAMGERKSWQFEIAPGDTASTPDLVGLLGLPDGAYLIAVLGLGKNVVASLTTKLPAGCGGYNRIELPQMDNGYGKIVPFEDAFGIRKTLVVASLADVDYVVSFRNAGGDLVGQRKTIAADEIDSFDVPAGAAYAVVQQILAGPSGWEHDPALIVYGIEADPTSGSVSIVR